MSDIIDTTSGQTLTTCPGEDTPRRGMTKTPMHLDDAAFVQHEQDPEETAFATQALALAMGMPRVQQPRKEEVITSPEQHLHSIIKRFNGYKYITLDGKLYTDVFKCQIRLHKNKPEVLMDGTFTSKDMKVYGVANVMELDPFEPLLVDRKGEVYQGISDDIPFTKFAEHMKTLAVKKVMEHQNGQQKTDQAPEASTQPGA